MLRLFAAFAIFAVFAPPVKAANRCVLPTGRIVYTDATCESVGAKLQREVKPEVAGPAPAATRRPTGGGSARTVCYDPKDGRPEVTHEEVEAAVRSATAAWNSGCKIRFEFVGACSGTSDFRVSWVSFPAEVKFEGKSIRDHAVAAANPAQGLIGLNRTLDSKTFLPQWRRSLAHEFGHLAGLGHSSNPADLMFSGGTQAQGPTAADFAACNQAAGTR